MLVATLSLTELAMVPVIHCYDSWAVVIRAMGWSIAYSGDTRPCTVRARSLRHGFGMVCTLCATVRDPVRQARVEDTRHVTVWLSVQVFAQQARGVELVIHEATFEAELQSHADSKRHSTVDEAMGIATMAQAQYLIATHFSQRYAVH